MKLYLVRHGEPMPESADPKRPLSDQGRLEVERVAAFLKSAGIEVPRVLHSGKLRAAQTAEIIAAAVAPGTAIEAVDGIAPNDDPAPFADGLDGWSEDCAVVGHLPFMQRLASLLVAGPSRAAAMTFQAGSVACLERSPGGWALLWMIAPELLK